MFRWLRKLLFYNLNLCPLCLRKLERDYETSGGHPMGEKHWFNVCPKDECEFNEDIVYWLHEGIFSRKPKLVSEVRLNSVTLKATVFEPVVLSEPKFPKLITKEQALKEEQ